MKQIVKLLGVFSAVTLGYILYKWYRKRTEWWNDSERCKAVIGEEWFEQEDVANQREHVQPVETGDVLAEAHLEGEPLPSESEGEYFVLNTKSGKIHKPTCRLIIKHLNNASYTVISDVESAKAEGATLCSNCML